MSMLTYYNVNIIRYVDTELHLDSQLTFILYAKGPVTSSENAIFVMSTKYK